MSATAAAIENKRIEIRRKLWVHSRIVGRVPSPGQRARLSERLRAGGASDTEIELAYQTREECFIAVYEAMNCHRRICIVDGRLEIKGDGADIHQDLIDRWNTASEGMLSLAAITWTSLNEGMGRYKQ